MPLLAATPAQQSPPDRVRGPLLRAVLLLGALLVMSSAVGTADAAGSAKPAAKFTAFSTAWSGGAAGAVAGCLQARGNAWFRLLAYPLSGRARNMRSEQARATLKAYFKKIGGVKLRDVTPKHSPSNVRLFDYTYKPAGENARTTRLHVQLKQDKKRLWVLASVTESSK
jgi:hypothetical protein